MIVGEHTYHTAHITELFTGQGAGLIIGKYCSIAEDVTVMLGGNHHAEWISTFPFNAIVWPELGPKPDQNSTKGNVTIGNDVWIGREVMILSGVTIGDGAIIAARSVVTKDVYPYQIWAGNPARFKRKRFSMSDVAELLAMAWWNWPDEKVKRAAPILMAGDLDALRKFAKE